MAIRRLFSCNVCRDEFGTIEQAAESLVGFRYAGAEGVELRLYQISAVEHHICRNCLAGLAKLAKASGLEESPR